MIRLRLAVTVVVAALAAAAAPALAGSGDAHSQRITAHFDDDGWLLLTPQACSAAQTGLCKLSAEGTVTWTGDLDGFSEYHAYGWVDPANHVARFKVWETFTGTVAGCGTGSIRWIGDGQIAMDGFDPATMSAPFTMTWRLLPGAGTGGLAGVTGHGTAGGPMNVLTRENHGTLTGDVDCATPPVSQTAEPD